MRAIRIHAYGAPEWMHPDDAPNPSRGANVQDR